MDVAQGSTVWMAAMNEDSMSSLTKSSITRKTLAVAANPPKVFEDPRDRASFLKDLYHYHDSKGTPISRPPQINGREVDLHKLYTLVIGRGGWGKVNFRNEWEELVPEFDIPAKCVNASVAIKQIYMRYLDRYEKLHFITEDNDRTDDADDEHNRHKKWSNKNLMNEVPLKYNYGQHMIPEGMRSTHKMSTDLYKSSEYERLMMSLMSPLPNEQDFAINVCTLMANESKHTLKIDSCPKLLEILLGHAGVYSHFTLRVVFIEFYSKVRRNSLQSFWSDCLSTKPNILELSYDDYYETQDEKLDYEGPLDGNRVPEEMFEDGLNSGSSELDADANQLDFLNLRRGLGTHDYIGQRVHQIASIIRNLTFIDDNICTLVQNRSFLRFLVMCSNIRWGNLHHMALDMLGNVAPEVELADPSSDDLTRSLLSTVTEGLESPDRGVIISCLEVLYKLSQKESNEEYLHKGLDAKTYNQICRFLSLNDIMLLLYTLECIYALTATGEKSCQAIMQVNGLIDQLVSLITVEAQSYGPDGCILMRVVETVPTSMAGSAYASPSAHSTHLHSMANVPHPSHFHSDASRQIPNTFDTYSPGDAHKNAHGTSPVYAHPGQPSPPPANLQQIHRKLIQSPPPSPAPQPPVPVTIKAESPAVSPTLATPTTVAAPTKLAQVQAQQDNEQFALAWLRATFEPAETIATRIEQQDMYKMYLTASSKIGRVGVASPLHFPRCVRTVFGGTVGPNIPKGAPTAGTESPTLFYEGIRIRAKPLAVMYKGQILQGQVEMVTKKPEKPATHILQKALSTVDATSSASPMDSTVSTVSSTTSQPTAGGTSAPVAATTTSTTTTTTQTSLIKSLLANKVTPHAAPGIHNHNNVTDTNSAVAAPTNHYVGVGPSSNLITANVNVHQVAQRQQIQKQKELALQQQQHGAKQVEPDSTNSKWDSVPPLAPLSSPAIARMPAPAGDDTTDENHSQLANPNQMLADLLERKSAEPSFGAENTLKRKMNPTSAEPAAKRTSSTEGEPVASTTSAANLYAKLAASLLEDEDEDEVVETTPTQQQQQPPQQPTHVQHQPPAVAEQPQIISMPMPLQMQRQLIVTPNQPPQMIVQQTNPNNQMPMIIQQNMTGPQGNFQIQKQIVGQQIMQQPSIMQQAQQQPGQTQYVLTTNQQGQTYLVAQQAPQQAPPVMQPQQQTVLVQGSGANKTIYILQQPGGGAVQQQPGTIVTGGLQQKVIMQPGGQPMLVSTQHRPMMQQQSHPVFVNQPNGNIILQQQTPQIIGQTIITNITQQQQQQQLMLQQSQSQPTQMIVQQQPQTVQAPMQQVTFQPIQSGGVIVGEKRVYLTQKGDQKVAPKVQQQQQRLPASPQVTPKPLPMKPQPPVAAQSAQSQKPPTTPQQKLAARPTQPTAAAKPTPTKTKSKSPPSSVAAPAKEEPAEAEANWLFVCDWRGCPRKRFRSANEVYLHTCQVHCPDNIDANAEIYCQWGPGPNLCDNLPRKRFSLMTHLFDRHCTIDSFKMGVQRRLTTPVPANAPTTPVTIIKNPTAAAAASTTAPADSTSRTASPTMSTSANTGLPAASAALQAIKRHALDFINPKELMDENEGPVTKSIRLTAALILRNLVNYTTTAKRSLRFYEPHLAGVALSNVESSRTIAQVLFEMNESYAV